MKKYIKIINVLLIVICCFSISEKFVNAAPNIYFAGLYQRVEKNGDFTNYYTLDMQQYSSPEGNKKGNFTLQEESETRLNFYVEGELKKISKNKYRCKKGKITLTFKVYKKKVIVKQKGKQSKSVYCDFSGIYRKIESYPLP